MTLTACGGGGGGSTPVPPPSQPPTENQQPPAEEQPPEVQPPTEPTPEEQSPTENQPPNVQAGDDQSVAPSAVVNLSGVVSDSDGNIESYQWTQISGIEVELSSTDSPDTSFTAPFVQSNETLIFELSATDNDGETSSDRVNISITPGSFSISGTIEAAPRSYVDSDVNDGTTSLIRNNTSATAQAIPNVATIGGFLSKQGTGLIGDHFETDFDEDDAYSVYLEAGQRIVLTVSEFDETNPTAVDLDIAIYRQSDLETPVASSLTTSAVESIDVEESGDYFILAYAHNGISNYNLFVGWRDLATTSSQLNTEQDFVTKELLGSLKETLQLPKQTSSKSKSVSSTSTTSFTASSSTNANNLRTPHRITLNFNDAPLQLSKSATSNSTSSQNSNREWGWGEKSEKFTTISALKELRKHNPTSTLSLNYIRHTAAIPNDDYYNLQWHYPQINLPQAWEFSDGSNVVVAVIDTGVYMEHPDLAANLTSDGYDFISSTSVSNDGDGIDDNPDDPGDEDAIASSSFHGTHVAGTIAALSNNNFAAAGIAWNTKIMPIRVLGKNGGTDYDLIQGIRYAAGLSNDSQTLPSTPANIINMSLAGPGFNALLQNAINEAINQGVVIIASAGNESTSTPNYPASNSGVISVSASNFNDELASYSNFGSDIDIAAPGGDSTDENADGYVDGVLSTSVQEEDGQRTPTLSFQMGTSMAAPHVAGVAALMKSIHPNLTPQQFENAIASGAITQDIAGDGEAVRNNQFGYGRIDALKAVEHANQLNSGSPLPAILSAQPSAINFGISGLTAELTLSNLGTAGMSVTGISDDADWLAVTALSVDGNGLGSYTVAADRDNLSEGTHLATITITDSDSKELAIPVSLTVITATNISADVGKQWVLLIDPESDIAYTSETATANQGSYSYQFNNIPAGSYLVVSGSDSDNDLLICDGGESCGAYPVLGEPSIVTIDSSSASNINFISSFSSNISVQASSVNSMLNSSSEKNTAQKISGFNRSLALPKNPRPQSQKQLSKNGANQ